MVVASSTGLRANGTRQCSRSTQRPYVPASGTSEPQRSAPFGIGVLVLTQVDLADGAISNRYVGTRRQKEAAAAAAPGAAPLVDASSLSRTSDKDLWLAHKRSEWEHGIRRRRSLESGQPYRPPMAGGGELERPFVPDDYDGSELDELEQLNNRVRGNAPAPASPQSVHASRSPSRSPSRPISAPLFSASSLSTCGSSGLPPLSTIAARSSTSPTRSGEGSPLNGTPRRDVLRLEEITILRLR